MQKAKKEGGGADVHCAWDSVHVYFERFKTKCRSLVAHRKKMNSDAFVSRGLEGFTAAWQRARRRGFSDLWQMAVLNIRDKPGTCSAGGNKRN